jgi:broad specificity phosphatase PhoE
MNIYLIRHAASTGNENPFNYLKISDKDIDLSEKGVEQAKELSKDSILNTRFYSSIIFSSPYLRALKTAQITLGEKLKYKIIENPLLIERNWGKLRNKVFEKRHTDEDFTFFNRPEGGESFFDLYQRVVLFISFLKIFDNNENNDYYIFTHGEWMKVFVMVVNNTTISEFEQTCKKNKIKNCEIRKYVL